MTGNVDIKQQCLDRIQVIFRVVFDNEELILSEVTSQEEVVGWDQTSHLDLVAAIEKAFDVRLTTREVWQTGTATSTVGLLLEVLSAKIEAASHSFRYSLEKAASDSQRRRLIEVYVQEQLAGVLNIDKSGIDPEKAFQNLGVTSLTAVELCSRLELGLGLSLAPTVVYNYPNLAQLVPYVACKLGLTLDDKGLVTSGMTRNLDGILEELGHLSEEEAERLLAGESKGGGDSDE